MRSGKLSATRKGGFSPFVSFQHGKINVIKPGSCMVHSRELSRTDSPAILGCSSILAVVASRFHGDATPKTRKNQGRNEEKGGFGYHWHLNPAELTRQRTQRFPNGWNNTYYVRNTHKIRFALPDFHIGTFSQCHLQDEDTGVCHPPWEGMGIRGEFYPSILHISKPVLLKRTKYWRDIIIQAQNHLCSSVTFWALCRFLGGGCKR